MPDRVDVLISGGGVAGLTAAAAFGAAGFSVICADPAPPATDEAAKDADLRSTAFLQPAQALLAECGVWERIAPRAAALQIMRIVDAGGVEPEPRSIQEFDAADISGAPFGWNIPNWFVRREIAAHMGTLPNVDFRPGIATTRVTTRENEARVSLSDRTRVSARLLIAADGRDSPTRRALGIRVKTTRYGQKALAFAATHPIPHGNVSTEIHRSGGPFTLAPLPDHDNLPCSAIVWMETGPEAVRLAGLPEAEFEEAMNIRSCRLFGPLKPVSRRTVWPIVSQIAGGMNAQRSALIAEAAHVVPPIGAQGLNMSLGDLRVLLDLARETPEELGSARMLSAYHRRRHPEVRLRVTGIDALNRAAMANAQGLRDMRAATLNALCSVAPLRRALMRAGLGRR